MNSAKAGTPGAAASAPPRFALHSAIYKQNHDQARTVMALTWTTRWSTAA